MTSPLSRTSARPAPQEDAHSQALRAKVERHLAGVRATAEIQAAIVLQMRRSLAALEKLPGNMYTRQWFEAREAEIRAAAQQALDDIENTAADHLQAAREAASEAAKRQPPANSQEALLLEAQVGNAWQSLKQILERAATQADGLAAIEAAAASASSDPVKIEALRRFGDDWVAGTFHQEPRYARQRILDALHAGTDAAEAPTWTPTQKAAREVLADLDRGQGRLQVSSHEARREVGGHGAIAGALAGWDDATTIPLSHKGQAIPPEADSVVRATFGEDAQAWEAGVRRNYPMLSEQGAVRGTVADMSPEAQLWRRIDAATSSTRATGQE